MRTRCDRVAIEVKRNWGVPGRSGQALRNHGHHIILPDLHRQQLCSEQTPATHAHTVQRAFSSEKLAQQIRMDAWVARLTVYLCPPTTAQRKTCHSPQI